MHSVQEEWLPVIGYEGSYEVSNMGRVRSLDRVQTMKNGVTRPFRGKMLTPCWSRSSPYPGVYVSNDRRVLVHHLVMAAFVGPRPEGHHVNHKNGIQQDNRLSNLEYVTVSENVLHAYRIGLSRAHPKRGEDSPLSKLTAQQVRYIRSQRGKKSHRRLAEELGCSKGAVSHIMMGLNWKHLL